MRKLISLMVLSIIFIQPAYAESDKRERHGKRVEHLMKKLDLSEEQKEPVMQIMQEQRQKAHAIFSETREQVKPQMEALQLETRERLAGILNDEQLQKFDTLSQKRREKMEKRFAKGGRGGWSSQQSFAPNNSE